MVCGLFSLQLSAQTDMSEQWKAIEAKEQEGLTKSANELAHEIAAKSPSAVRAAKRLIAYAESGASQAEVLLRESDEQLDLIGKPDQIEAVAAQLQKRPPEFT